MPSPHGADLVGRDDELEQLSDLLGIGTVDIPGEAAVVLLGGDAGVGKTRLLLELRDQAFGHDWVVLAGHCLDLTDSTLPYLPFSEILSRLAAEVPEVVETTLRAHPALGRLLSGRRARSADEGADESALDPGEVFTALHALLDETALLAPVLVVLEDAHWADRSTRDLLSFLFTRPFAGQVAVVVSYRSDDVHRRHPLRRQAAEWTRLRNVERVQLQPLEDAEVRQLVALLHPDPLPEAGVADIVDRAEGNPFFVEELVGATASGEDLPAELADVLLVRLDQLDDDARQVVRAASVSGRRARHDTLAGVCGLDAGRLEAALRSAVDAQVLVPERGDSYSFRHALLGEAVYDDLLPGERQRLHEAYVGTLREDDRRGAAAELARHARLARDPRTSLFASIEAGDEARRLGGPEEAAGHFAQALELTRDPGVGDLTDLDVPRLVMRMGESMIAAGEVAKAVAGVREHLERLPEDARLARGDLLNLIANALLLADSAEDPIPVAEEALALLHDGTPAQRARALAVLARAHTTTYGDRAAARQAALEALEIAEGHSLPRIAADATTTLVGLDQGLGGGDADVVHALEDVIALAHSADALPTELRGRFVLGRVLQDRGDLVEAIEAFDGVVALGVAEGTPWDPYVSEARLLRALALQTLGRWDEAIDSLSVAGGRPPPLEEVTYASLQAWLRASRGEEQTRLLRHLRGWWRRDGMVVTLAASAELEVAEREAAADRAVHVYDDAVAAVAVFWGGGFLARIRLAARVLGVLAAAAPTLSTEDRQRLDEVAARLHEDAAEVAEIHREAGRALGPESSAWLVRLEAELLRWRWLAQVAPPALDDLVDAWRASVAAYESSGDVFELARARTRLAGVLRAAGDTTAAADLERLARPVATTLRTTPLLAELDRQGAAGRSAPSRGPSTDLTPREREILALVSQGRTNGEIGRQLFISTKTVSVHVSNILGKLGAASRTEAAALAAQRGLLP